MLPSVHFKLKGTLEEPNTFGPLRGLEELMDIHVDSLESLSKEAVSDRVTPSWLFLISFSERNRKETRVIGSGDGSHWHGRGELGRDSLFDIASCLLSYQAGPNPHRVSASRINPLF